MKHQLIKNAVMSQGHGAYGYIQFGGTIFMWGDTGTNDSPLFQLVLFRPYSKQWFYFNARGLTKRAGDGLRRLWSVVRGAIRRA